MDVRAKMGVKKYFIGIVIPEPLFTLIEALKADLMERHGLKGALRSPAHITLHRPFEWKEEKESVLIDKLKSLRLEKKFEIELKNFAFFEPRVVYVNVEPNEALNEMHHALKVFAKRELRLLNEWEDMRGFHPHITIANRDLKKPKFYELQAEFSEKTFSGIFNFEEICLLRLEKTWQSVEHFKI